MTTFNLLHSIVGNGHRAQRHAPMTATGSAKYYTVHQPLTDDQIAAHLSGSATYAVPLIGTDKLASAGLIELDCDHLDGARRVQEAAAARGVTMMSIATHGADTHDGSHNWVIFAERVDPRAARKLMQDIAKDAGYPKAETWPNGENIRLPFGMHRWTGDWGITLLPTGEIFDNNDPAERAAASAAVLNLPLNGQPPNILQKIAKSQPVQGGNISTLKQSPGRASLADVKARFNAAHTWPELLSDKGGIERRDGWACNCGWQHTHTTQLAITSQDKIVSFSPNCRWAPHKDSGKALDKFGFYVDQWHAGNVVDALKTLNPIEPRKSTSDTMSPVEARYTDEQRQAYNAARKAKRHQETREALDAIYDAVNSLDFTQAVHPGANAEAHDARTRLVIMRLMAECYERGVLQCALTNEQLSADLDMCERYVTVAFKEMQLAGLGKRQGGKGGNQPNQAATWTFYRAPNLGRKSHQDAIYDLSYIELDLIQDHVLASEAPPHVTQNETPERDHDGADDARTDCGAVWLDSRTGGSSRAGTNGEWIDSQDWPAESGDYETALDTWEACDVEHGADELSALEMVPIGTTAEPETELGTIVPTLRTSHGRYQVSDGVRFGGWSATAAGAWEQWSPVQRIEQAQPANFEKFSKFDDSAEPAGASYTPTELPAGRVYTGTARQYMTYEQRAALALETMRRLPDADADEPAEQPTAKSKKRRKRAEVKGVDRYRLDLVRMSESELAGELRKHTATLKKHSGAAWLSGIRDRLAMVEHEIDARALHGVAIAPRSQAPARRPAHAYQGALPL